MAETKLKSQAIEKGVILQIVTATYSTQLATSSTSFVDTGLTASITPQFSNSKILVQVKTGEIRTYDASSGAAISLIRGSTEIAQVTKNAGFPTANARTYASLSYVDSPNTTSSTTYKLQIKRQTGTGDVSHCEDTSESHIVLMEIKQ